MVHQMKVSARMTSPPRRVLAGALLGAALLLGLCTTTPQGSASAAAAGLPDLKTAGTGEATLLTRIGQGNKWKKGNKKYYKKNYYYGPRVKYWKRQPYYGEFIGGVVLGTILGATIVGVAPPPPGPEFCWNWTDPSMTRGYWDYCDY